MSNFLEIFFRSFPLLLKGAFMTFQVLLLSASLSFTLGTAFGILSCSRLKIAILSSTIEGVTFVLRAVPFFVQLLIVYFVLPDLFGINLNPFPAAVISLGVCSSGYVAQIIRGGINAVPITQWESAFSLGYSSFSSLIYIILPQTFRQILPMLNNELDALLKSTAIASSIGMLELTRMGMNLVSREMQPVPIYLSVAFFYLCMSAVLNLLSRTLERKITYVNR